MMLYVYLSIELLVASVLNPSTDGYLSCLSLAGDAVHD